MKKFIYLLFVMLIMPTTFTYGDDARCYAEGRNEPLEVLGVQIEAISKMTAMINSEEEGGPEMSTYFGLMVDSVKKIYEICPSYKEEVMNVLITYRVTPTSTEWKEEVKQGQSIKLIEFVKEANTVKGSFAYELLDSIK